MIEKVLQFDTFFYYFKYIYLQRITSSKHLGKLKCKQIEIRKKSLDYFPVENDHFFHMETNKREPAVRILLHVNFETLIDFSIQNV